MDRSSLEKTSIYIIPAPINVCGPHWQTPGPIQF